MGRIKSALEIALERTESVKADKAGINQYELRQQGKKLANGYLESSSSTENKTPVNLEEAIKKTAAADQAALKQGIFEALISQIVLPSSDEDRKRIDAIGKGLQLIIGNPQFSAMYRRLKDALARYMDETARYDEAIKRQYAPKLRQKEEEMSRYLGRKVQIDPFQDPEFVGFYNQNMNALKGNYQSMIDQVRDEANRIFGVQ
ncbi:MAG: hypothetical protein LBP76_09270 [Treponema sp.]|jgi:hypothetical protein|nr:hypothetical protein [Treponema sp.]